MSFGSLMGALNNLFHFFLQTAHSKKYILFVLVCNILEESKGESHLVETRITLQVSHLFCPPARIK